MIKAKKRLCRQSPTRTSPTQAKFLIQDGGLGGLATLAGCSTTKNFSSFSSTAAPLSSLSLSSAVFALMMEIFPVEMTRPEPPFKSEEIQIRRLFPRGWAAVGDAKPLKCTPWHISCALFISLSFSYPSALFHLRETMTNGIEANREMSEREKKITTASNVFLKLH